CTKAGLGFFDSW
nr:immunoglobulin heavy chain junction region [Macaca mulatta]